MYGAELVNLGVTSSPQRTIRDQTKIGVYYVLKGVCGLVFELKQLVNCAENPQINTKQVSVPLTACLPDKSLSAFSIAKVEDYFDPAPSAVYSQKLLRLELAESSEEECCQLMYVCH